MNWLLIAVLAVLFGLAFNGYHKGFIKILISFLSLIVTIVAVWFATPYVSDFLTENTPLYDTVKDNITEMVGGLGEGQSSEGLPQILNDLMQQNSVEQTPENEEESFLEASGIDESIGGYLAGAAVRLISFVSIFLVLTLILRFTLFTFDFIANLPVLRGINKMAGLVVGAAEGVLAIWIGFLVLTVIAGTEYGRIFFDMISENSFLTWLYRHNYLLILVLRP